MRQKPPKGLRPNCLLTRYPICFIHGLKNIFCALDYWNGVPEYLAEHGYEIHVLKGPWRGPHNLRVESFAQQIGLVLKRHPQVHIIAHSLGTLDSLDLTMREDLKGRISSVTLISPPFGGSPFAELGLIFGKNLFRSTNDTLTEVAASKIVSGFVKPSDLLLGSIVSRPSRYPISKGIRVQHHLLKKYLDKKKLSTENDGLVPLESQLVAKSLGPIFKEFPGDHIQVIGAGPWPKNEKTAHATFLDHAIFLAEYDFKKAQ